MSALPVDRRALIKAGGALVVGFSLAGRATAQDGEADASAPAPAPARGETAGPPDPSRVDTWIAVHADTTATIYIGYVELGQGTTTSLPMVAAEELGLRINQVRTVPHDTNVTPNQGGTYSSASIARGSPQVRAAAAEARQALLAMASEQLNAPVDQLTVSDGVVTVEGLPGRSVSYGDLMGGKLFERTVSGDAPTRPPASYQLVGTKVPRRDIPGKVLGLATHIQHLRLDGMLHARVVRPRGQPAFGAGAKPLRVDAASIAAIPGARVLRRGDFLGVVAPKEWDAVRAAAQLDVTWDESPSLPGSEGLYDYLKQAEATDRVVAETGDVEAAFARAAHVVEHEGRAPYQSHAPFAPNCALADVSREHALVICSSQDIYAARRTLAPLLGLEESQIRVQYAESAGTYGHSCYDDAAQAAAILSQLAGAPVRLQFMRWDEHGWDTYGTPHVGHARVAADADGDIVAYAYEGWQHNWAFVEASAQLATGADAAEWPNGAPQGVNPPVCGGMYAIPNLKLVDHRVSGAPLLRTAWLRSPLDLALTSVSEQAIDQLAYELDMDPVAFRRRNIADARWRGVLDAAARAANWTPRRAASAIGRGNVVRGRGVGLGTHLASWGGAVAEVEVDRSTGVVRVTHLTGAIDAGLAVNPGVVEAQIEGQLVQTVGRMLYEEVTFDERGVTSLDWASYPVARFADAPELTPVVVQHLDEPSSGAGEEVMAAAAAAIANAFFDATGVRMRRFPFTPERVMAALAEG